MAKVHVGGNSKESKSEAIERLVEYLVYLLDYFDIDSFTFPDGTTIELEKEK